MISREIITLQTNEGISIYDITLKVKEIYSNSRIKNGSIIIFTTHTTTAIKINENECRLLEDINTYFEQLIPIKGKYLHDDIHLRDCPPDERINGHAHLKAMLLNTSETIPIIGGKLALGKWQSILFLEFDGSRKREIIVQTIGE
jgi:secondary thiamine-phosphate synthase enzyme